MFQDRNEYNHPAFVQRGKAISEALDRILFTQQRGITNLLDLGCGIGPYFSNYATYGCFVIGVDVDAARLKKARQRAETVGIFSQFIRVDAEHLPFRERSFDVAVVAEVLEHTNEPAAVLAGLHRCIKTNGHIILTFPWLSEFRVTALASIIFLREITVLKAGHPGPLFKFLFNLANIRRNSKALGMRRRKIPGLLIEPLWFLGKRTRTFRANFSHYLSISAEEFVILFCKNNFPSYFGHKVMHTPSEWKKLVLQSGHTKCFETGALLFPPIFWRLKPMQPLLSHIEARAHWWVRKWLSQSFVIAARAT